MKKRARKAAEQLQPALPAAASCSRQDKDGKGLKEETAGKTEARGRLGMPDSGDTA